MDRLQIFFNENNDLRLFAMNGSKINTNIPDDKFKDFDVVFFTDKVEKYKYNKSFLKRFGEILLITEPDKNEDLFPLTFPEKDGYIYLVQYTNGERIDFQFQHLKRLENYLKEDSLTKIIGDKDSRIKNKPIPSDRDYWIELPAAETVTTSIEEFYWQFNNALKATLRNEFLLAQQYINLVRNELIRLMTWYTSYKDELKQSFGKANHQILEHLNEETSTLLCSTFDTQSNKDVYISLKTLKILEEQFIYKISHTIPLSNTSELQKIPTRFLRSKNEEKLAIYFSE